MPANPPEIKSYEKLFLVKNQAPRRGRLQKNDFVYSLLALKTVRPTAETPQQQMVILLHTKRFKNSTTDIHKTPVLELNPYNQENNLARTCLEQFTKLAKDLNIKADALSLKNIGIGPSCKNKQMKIFINLIEAKELNLRSSRVLPNIEIINHFQKVDIRLGNVPDCLIREMRCRSIAVMDINGCAKEETIKTFIQEWLNGEREIDSILIDKGTNPWHNYRNLLKDLKLTTLHNWQNKKHSLVSTMRTIPFAARHVQMYVFFREENVLDQLIVVIMPEAVLIRKCGYFETPGRFMMAFFEACQDHTDLPVLATLFENRCKSREDPNIIEVCIHFSQWRQSTRVT